MSGRSVTTYRISWLWLPILTAVMALAACSDWINEPVEPCPQPADKSPELIPIYLHLEIHTPSGKKSYPTRSPETERENRIDHLRALLFRTDANGDPTTLIMCMKPFSLHQDPNQPNLYKADFNELAPDTIGSRSIRVVLLANAGPVGQLFDPEVGAPGTYTYSQLKSTLHSILTSPDTDLSQPIPAPIPSDEETPLLMWAMPHDLIEVRHGVDATLEACMMRDVARVDVRVEERLHTSETFVMRSVYIYKPSTSICHIPDDVTVAETLDDFGHPYMYAHTPTLDGANDVWYRWDYEEQVDDNGVFEAKCYIPEGETVMAGRNNGAGKPFDVNHTNRPAVIVGGYYNASKTMSYYRIDFCNGEGKLVDILRNHLYDIHVRSVLGPGEPTPDEAYESNKISLVAEITDWCMVDNDVMFEGAEWITVSKRVLHFTGNAGAGNTFVVNSSIPVEEWEFALGEDDFSYSSLLQSDNFFVARPIAEEDSKILVVTKNPLEPGQDPVSERLNIRIGNVQFYITLVQYPVQQSYWFLADYFTGSGSSWEHVIDFPIGGLHPNVPKNNFLEFLNWLFGGNYDFPVGDGDHVSDNEYVNLGFWKFLDWFFTDPYGHYIGGTPDQWGEDWSNPIAVLVYDLVQWVIGGNYREEIGWGPVDPDNPNFATVGADVAASFLEWVHFDEFREWLGQMVEDPDKPFYATEGTELLSYFWQWTSQQPIDDWLEAFKPPEYDPGDQAKVNIDKMISVLTWLLKTDYSGILGDEPDGNGDVDPGGNITDHYLGTGPWGESHDIEHPVGQPPDTGDES